MLMLISQVWLLSGCVESVKPDCVSLGCGLSDQELATDDELLGNENEPTDSDSSIDNNLDHLCTAKSTIQTEGQHSRI